MEEDDAVDYLLYEDLKKEGFLQNRGRVGCLGLLIIMLIPVSLWTFLDRVIFALL